MLLSKPWTAFVFLTMGIGMTSGAPTKAPTPAPSDQPSMIPSEQPSAIPSEMPSESPSSQPSSIPSSQPSMIPSEQPSSQPSSIPSESPSSQPSSIPSSQPSSIPSEQPSSQPSSQPSTQPSSQPSESPSANPSQGCENIRTDCGWGIFNPWTCACDCPVGICLDANEQCYDPCIETIQTNPWAGCSPGWDCPWFPDGDSGHCRSELHQPNNFEIYRTSKECCDAHFSGSSTCLSESKASHDPFPFPNHFPDTPEFRGFSEPVAVDIWGTEASHDQRWFPDLLGKLNCVFGSNYETWMSEDGFRQEYLSGTFEDCCERWFPQLGTDCPAGTRAANPEAEDEPWMASPYSAQNYYFPDFGVDSCGFGRDYPAYMGINGYEKTYLFTVGSECCDRFFPDEGNCPFENTVQLDYFWTTYEDNIDNLVDMPIRFNHTFYPDLNANNCVNGTDNPKWMEQDDEFKRMYLFKNHAGCCTRWFPSDVDGCLDNVVQGVYSLEPCPLNRPECHNVPIITNVWTMWYPDIDGYRCKNDGQIPDWMLLDGYVDLYLFNTEPQCCAAFGYC